MALRQLTGPGPGTAWDLTGGGFAGIGSNNWVVGGSHTESGLPVLANDPHLSIQMPSIWYQNGLHCRGTPKIARIRSWGSPSPAPRAWCWGTTRHLAWGVTNQSADTQDLFIEKVNPENPAQYEYQGEWVDMEVRPETIVVAGGDDIDYDVMVTRHGPVISDTYFDEPPFEGPSLDLPEDYVVSLAWQTLQPSTLVEAIIGMNRATSHEEFRSRLIEVGRRRPEHRSMPMWRGTSATRRREAPIRAGGDGSWPVRGMDRGVRMDRCCPIRGHAGLFNPPTDYIATANNPVLSPGSRAVLLDRCELRLSGGPDRGDDRGEPIRVSRSRRHRRSRSMARTAERPISSPISSPSSRRRSGRPRCRE